jgi:hypothetical protein
LGSLSTRRKTDNYTPELVEEALKESKKLVINDKKRIFY